MEDDKLTLEVLVHFVDKNGKRIKPSCNRIMIPLQVSEINNTERVMLTKALTKSVSFTLGEAEFLQRLVLVPEKAEKLVAQHGSGYCKLLALEAFPMLDNIEIQDILHNDQ